MEITSEELQKKIDNGDKLIVDFWGRWCGPCKVMKPAFDKVSQEFRDKNSDVQFYSLDVDRNRELAYSLGIKSIPTVKIFKNKEVVDTKIGMLMETQLRSIAEELING